MNRRAGRRDILIVGTRLVLAGLLLSTLAGIGVQARATEITAASPGAINTASYVNPFIGTGSGGPNVGQIDTFPGASAPFGMVQWSPDTTSRPDGGGYAYADRATTGFSLTHLSGSGCPVFGDVPFLPVDGSVPSKPGSATEPFTHIGEQASPGRYSVTLGTPSGPLRVELSATTRTGIGSFSFPVSTSGSASDMTMLVNATGGANIAGNSYLGSVDVVNPHEVVGSTVNGAFCISRNTYKLYFAARFSQAAVKSGTWSGTETSPVSACSGVACGAYLTFAPDASGHASPLIVKVAVSYVSAANALANLAAEDSGWDLSAVEHAASLSWNSILSRVVVTGGTTDQVVTFYTALYHAFLDPTTFSDIDGCYPTFSNVEFVATGISCTSGVQYANFSMWDTYRTQMPLIAMLDPQAASDMVTSLLNDASQGGWLPRWPVANSYTGTQSGDSADPLIAGAYAFGARQFDVGAALADMVRGATDPSAGSSVEDLMFESDSLLRYEQRPGLPDYESRHYVPNFMFRQSSGVPDGTSTSLEYALDDASVGLFAASTGEPGVAREMLSRAQNWEYSFNAAYTSTGGYVEPRGESGAFPPGDPVQPPPPNQGPYPVDQIYFGQSGFQEGNAAQYTWMVPFDMAGLVSALGGRGQANSRLDAFFDRTADPAGFGQAGPTAPYYWAGNEPDMQTPWLYDYTGEPYKTQALVHQIEAEFFTNSPGGEPGNDDLGTVAAWYVWAALGLYPELPGDGSLVLSSPLFPKAHITVPGRGSVEIDAPGASSSEIYVQSASLNGQPLSSDWVTYRSLMPGANGGAATSAKLFFVPGTTPNRTWASEPAGAPPSYGQATPNDRAL
ncbi:MAG TPA: GH92 family glycosyl hydrolase, partial [Acidimicrobiales bacterium]|nr:GH92 family glycosyl hydrolase [Acidimicrobiales bacterium]